jgi:thiamine biosynthesis protein ThiS
MMEILVNGTPHAVPADTTVAQLLVILDIQGKRLAVEVNQELVPRSQFDSVVLNPHDTVEIVHAIGGG